MLLVETFSSYVQLYILYCNVNTLGNAYHILTKDILSVPVSVSSKTLIEFSRSKDKKIHNIYQIQFLYWIDDVYSYGFVYCATVVNWESFTWHCKSIYWTPEAVVDYKSNRQRYVVLYHTKWRFSHFLYFLQQSWMGFVSQHSENGYDDTHSSATLLTDVISRMLLYVRNWWKYVKLHIFIN